MEKLQANQTDIERAAIAGAVLAEWNDGRAYKRSETMEFEAHYYRNWLDRYSLAAVLQIRRAFRSAYRGVA